MSDKVAKTISMTIEVHESTSFEEVNLWRVVPPWIATKEGGATPKNVPTKKGIMGTSMTGDAMLINQLGRKGVIRRKMI